MNRQVIIASVLAALVFSGTGPAWSQAIGRPVQLVAAEGITALGHSEVKVKPDIALITLTVTTQSKDQAAAVRQNAARTTAALAALREAGIADKDIETQSYTVQPEYNNAAPPVLKGYQVQNSVQATVRDLTKVGMVIDKTTAGGASEIGGVSFDLSDRAAAQADALSQAVAAAKRKAGVMASAAGVSLGRLLTMTEGSVGPAIIPIEAPMVAAMPASVPETPIADQQITVSADATLVYAIGAVQ